METSEGRSRIDCRPKGAIVAPTESCNDSCPHWAACQAERASARQRYTDEGVENTIHAVTRRAMTDYIRSKSPEHRTALKKYFQSHNFESLTGLNGSKILQAIRNVERR